MAEVIRFFLNISSLYIKTGATEYRDKMSTNAKAYFYFSIDKARYRKGVPLKEKKNVIKTSTIIYSVNTILVYPQTALHQIKKKPEAIPLQKTEEACFRFCPRCGNNPFHRLIADYLAKKNLTSPG